MQTVTRNSHYIKKYETSSLKEMRRKVLTLVSFEMSGIYKTKGIAHKYCALVNKVISHRSMGSDTALYECEDNWVYVLWMVGASLHCRSGN